MCDTIVVLGNSSEDGSVIFGKNSDRDSNEAHMICYSPRSTYKDNEILPCEYINIPQVKETFALILGKPVWLKMGCEMGANEYGVVMGNETVFTKEKYERQALLGMDLMRIALERGKSASQALQIITELIGKHGQGGVASRNDPNYIYHNSFIIADIKQAWVLETADKFWAAKQVHDVATISNGLTIQDKWDLASPRLIEHAIEKGWCESKADFNFTNCYSDSAIRAVLGCVERQSRTLDRLLNNKGRISVSLMMELLRDHGGQFAREDFNPAKSTMSSICMHANSKAFSQTTGSFVAHLSKELQTHWLTGTSAPCLSIFKPFFFESPEALLQLQPTSLTSDASLWWRHEKLHRLTLMDYSRRAPIIIAENAKLEAKMLDQVKKIQQTLTTFDNPELKSELKAISVNALQNNFSIIDPLIANISKMNIEKAPPKGYLKYWTTLSQKDNMNL